MAEWVDTRREDGALVYSECFLGGLRLSIHRHVSLSYAHWQVFCAGLLDELFVYEKFSDVKGCAVAKLQIALQGALDEILKDCK